MSINYYLMKQYEVYYSLSHPVLYATSMTNCNDWLNQPIYIFSDMHKHMVTTYYYYMLAGYHHKYGINSHVLVLLSSFDSGHCCYQVQSALPTNRFMCRPNTVHTQAI